TKGKEACPRKRKVSTTPTVAPDPASPTPKAVPKPAVTGALSRWATSTTAPWSSTSSRPTWPPDPPGGTRARSTETHFDLHGGVLAHRGPARPRRATRPGSRSTPALGRTHPLTTHPTPACERAERPMLNADTVHSIIQTLGRGIWSSTTTPAGVLVTLSGKDTDDVINALRAAGYTATEVGSGTVM